MSDAVLFQVGDQVQRVVDDKAGIITAIVYRKATIEYLARWEDSNDEVFMYDFEIRQSTVSKL